MIPLLAAGVLLAADPPYLRTRVHPGDPQSHCLWWRAGDVLYQQSGAGHPDNPGETAFTSVEAAFQTWQAVQDRCGNLLLVEGPRTSSRFVGYDPAHREHLVLFREQLCTDVVSPGDPCLQAGTCGNVHDCWEHAADALALTTTTFDVASGEILDADIELNAAGYTLTTVDSPACQSGALGQGCVAYDVQATATHEIGHLLGLDHTDYPGSVMNPTARVGDLSKRTLDPGSQDFVCDVYPKGEASLDCVAPAPAPDGGCTAAGAQPWLVLALLGLWRRRRC
jgi:hypothetical protein